MVTVNEIRDYLSSQNDFISVGDVFNDSFTIGFDGDDKYKDDIADGSIVRATYDADDSVLILNYRNVTPEVEKTILKCYQYGELPDISFDSSECLQNEINDFITHFAEVLDIRN